MGEQKQKEQSVAPAPRSFRLLPLLASMRFAIGLVAVLAVICVVATLLPQGPEVAQRIRQDPAAGLWLRALSAIGLTDVFSAWWFTGLLGLLGASLAVCVARRVKALVAVTDRRQRLRMTGTLLVHAGLLLTLLGGVIRLGWSERGSVQFREGEQTAFFVTEDQRQVPLPFVLQLVKFEIERYPAPDAPRVVPQGETLAILWPGAAGAVELPVTVGVEQPLAASGTNPAFRVTVLRRVPDFVVDTATREVRSRSEQMRNPALLVRVSGGGRDVQRWLFARFPDLDMTAMGTEGQQPLPFQMRYQVLVSAPEGGRIKAFKSTLRVLDGGKVAREQTIEVNAPLSYSGYSFFQNSYNEEDPSWTALLVVRDPGVPVVYGGFLLLLGGVLVTACWRAEGTVRAVKETAV